MNRIENEIEVTLLRRGLESPYMKKIKQHVVLLTELTFLGSQNVAQTLNDMIITNYDSTESLDRVFHLRRSSLDVFISLQEQNLPLPTIKIIPPKLSRKLIFRKFAGVWDCVNYRFFVEER